MITHDISRLRAWMRRVLDAVYGGLFHRTRPATFRRRQEDQIAVIQEALAQHYHEQMNIQQEELNVLLERYDRNHPRPSR